MLHKVLSGGVTKDRLYALVETACHLLTQGIQGLLQKDTSAYSSPEATGSSRTIRSFCSLFFGFAPLRLLLTSAHPPICCSQRSTVEMRVSVFLFFSQPFRRDQMASLTRCPYAMHLKSPCVGSTFPRLNFSVSDFTSAATPAGVSVSHCLGTTPVDRRRGAQKPI